MVWCSFGEGFDIYWWAYRIGRPPSSSTLFKHLLRNHWANQWSVIISSPEPKVLGWAYRIRSCPLSSTLFEQLLLRNHWANQSNFIWNFYRIGEGKFIQMVLVTWPRWPLCLCMVKTLKFLLFRNQKAKSLKFGMQHDSGAQVLPDLVKWWRWVDLDLFYGKVKFGLAE